jgi:caa(3)-type oxidase subunit IV
MSLSQSNEIAAPVADDVKGGHADHAGVHAVPKRILLGVYGLLLLFTVITVGVSTLNLGPFNIWVALMVAVIKGGLVAMYFMHLRWDSPFNGLILIAALFFVALFIGIAMLDAHSYEVNMKPPTNVYMPDAADTVIVPGAPAVADDGPKIGPKPADMPWKQFDPAILDQVAATHGDALEGEQLFTKQGCVACHTVRKSDPLKGPCLADVAKKYSRRDLAENIMDPNMKIADGFITYHYKMNDDNVIEGFMVKETPEKIVLRNIAGQYLIVNPSDVAKSKKLTTSPMPEGLVAALTVKQFASIVDYLQALSGVK